MEKIKLNGLEFTIKKTFNLNGETYKAISFGMTAGGLYCICANSKNILKKFDKKYIIQRYGYEKAIEIFNS